MDLTKIKSTLSELAGRLKGLLSGLPDEAQLEAGSPQLNATRSLKTQIGDLQGAVSAATEQVGLLEQAAAAAPTDELREQVKKELIDSGEYVEKSAHEAAIQAAVGAKETELNQQFENSRQADKLAAERRGQLPEEVPAEARGAIPAEALTGETSVFEANCAKMKDRFSKLKSIRVTKGAILCEVASLPLDADGDAAFDAKLGTIKELASQFGGTGSPPPGDKNFQQQQQPGEKPVMI